MARRRSVLRALRSLERGVSRAYIGAIREKKIAIGEVEAAIRSGDQERILELISIDDEDLQDVIEELRNAALEGGLLERVGRNDRGINPNSQRMAEWLQAESSTLVTAVAASQREAVREVLAVAGQLGQNPRSTALDIVGRIGASGRREGGIVGLNGPQANAVANARLNLSSGNPELMRKYLQNERRDRRLDHIVKRRIAEGKPLNEQELARIIARYEDRLLQTRGETIARTETVESLNFGRQIKAQDLAERVDGEVWKTWEAGPDDGRQRESHAEADGQTVPIDDPFEVGGSLMMFPGDTSLGATAAEVINCRCGVTYEVRS